jgi:tetratricopeptide (TPR) repeat protein
MVASVLRVSEDLDTLMTEFWAVLDADQLGAAEDRANAVVARDRYDGLGYASRAIVKRRRAERLSAYADLLVAIALGTRRGADIGTLSRQRDELQAELFVAARMTGAAEDAVADAVLGTLRDLFDGLRDVAVEVVAGLLEVPTGFDGELQFVLGFAHYEDESYEQALSPFAAACGLIPNVLEAHYYLGRCQTLTGDDQAALRAHQAGEKTQVDQVLSSPAAQRVAALAASRPLLGTSRTRNLAALVQIVYDQKRYDEALSLAERLERLGPDRADHWQYRPMALTFLMRHEESIVAYGDAIRQMTAHLQRTNATLLGSDPRGLMHFNRGCELARLGRHDAALHDLKTAIDFAAKWASKAAHDDYWQHLWHDPRFLNLTQQAQQEQAEQAEGQPDAAAGPEVTHARVRALARQFVKSRRDDISGLDGVDLDQLLVEGLTTVTDQLGGRQPATSIAADATQPSPANRSIDDPHGPTTT